MDSLIERIEAATEGSRELDAAIEDAVNPLPSGDRPRWPFAEGSNLSKWTPRYTASLDAAMTLVPDDCVWLRLSRSTMSVSRPDPNEKRWAKHFEAKGATPALALVSAALKARTLPHDR